MKRSYLWILSILLVTSLAYGAQISGTYLQQLLNGTITSGDSTHAPTNGAVYTALGGKAASGANSDITSLSGLTTALSIGQGGTGATTQQAALDAIAGAVTSGDYIRCNGTHCSVAAIQAGDVPTLNQSTSGTAANLSGTPALPNGTTATTQSPADNSTKLATTAYVDAAVPAAVSYLKQAITLVTGDITAQYVDLSQQCKANSLHLAVGGLGYVIEDVDFTVSVVSSKTRVTFAGDLATAGATPLAASNVLYAKCVY